MSPCLSSGSVRTRNGRDHDDPPLRAPRRDHAVVRRGHDPDGLQLGVRRTPRPAADAVREGQAQAVGRADAHRLVDGHRPRGPGVLPRHVRPDLRLAVVGEDEPGREGPGPSPLRRLVELPVPPRRAGGAHLCRQDRPDGSRDRLQVLRRHAGDGRGPPRRGLQQVPPREARAGLPDPPSAGLPARPDDRRLPLGHHLPRHAGDDRGRGSGRLLPDPRLHRAPAVRGPSTPT